MDKLSNSTTAPFVSIGEAANSVVEGLKSSAPVKAIDLNDIQADVGNLYHLLDAATDDLMGVDFVRDGVRDVALDRVAALYWIARDMVDKMRRDIEENFHTIQKGAKL